jgi:hypothetical protein
MMSVANPFRKFFCFRLSLPAALLLAIAFSAGCATVSPARVNVGDVLQHPQDYKNKRVELTGLVLDYKPAQGDVYRTLIFTLGPHPEGELLVVGTGYRAEAIAKASFLVEQAYEANEPITVSGKLKLPKNAPPELRLETIRYKGQEIKVNKGPRTRPGFGFSVGGAYITPSIGIGATIHP